MSFHGSYGAFRGSLAFTDRDNNFSVRQNFNTGLNIAQSQHLYLDTDKDTSIVSYGDDNFALVVGNVQQLDGYDDHTTWFKYARWLGGLEVKEMAAPTNAEQYGWFYGKAVGGKCETFTMDEDGNETQLSSHDEDGYYTHRSKIPKRKLELQIDIEKFFRDNYPEYVNINGKQLKQKEKAGAIPNGKLPVFTPVRFKWYQLIKKWRYRKNGKR